MTDETVIFHNSETGSGVVGIIPVKAVKLPDNSYALATAEQGTPVESNATIGALTDAAVVTDANGSLSGKLRGLVKILADVWNTVTHAIRVEVPVPTVDADITQLVTVTTAGTPVQGPDKSNANGWVLVADPDNAKPVRWMFHGQTAAAKGVPISPGNSCVAPVVNLDDLDFDADTGGDGSKIWPYKL